MPPWVMFALSFIWLGAIIMGVRLGGPRFHWLWMLAPLMVVGWWSAMLEWCGRHGCP